MTSFAQSARAVTTLLTLLALWARPQPLFAADVYVAFDAQGLAQFADRPLDSRYQLLFKDLGAVFPESTAVRRRAVPASLRAELEKAAARHGLDYALLHAVVQAESAFDPGAVSAKGAIGLMQLMPATARRYGVEAADAATLAARLRLAPVNVEAGSRYLRDLLRRYDGDTELALAAYNAGEGAVQRAGNRVPDYPETRHYVRKVMATLERTAPPLTAAPIAPVGTTPAPAALPPAPARVERVRRKRQAADGVGTVQVYRGEASEIERFERGFAPAPQAGAR